MRTRYNNSFHNKDGWDDMRQLSFGEPLQPTSTEFNSSLE